MPLAQLRRVRWAVRCTLVLGVAASVAANVLHARPDPVAQIIAAWPPLALLLTVELISRVPVDRRLLAAARLVATTGIAAIAAWVSYWHMAGVASRYGEQGASPYLLPLSVDGLVIVASVSLVELAGRLRTAEHTTPRPVPAAAPAPTAIQNAVAWVQPGQPGRPDANPVVAVGRASFGGPAAHEPAAEDLSVDEPSPTVPPPWAGDPPGGAPLADAPVVETPPTDTADAVAYWRAKDPTMSVRDICAKVDRSERTVRRILDRLPEPTPAVPEPAASTEHRVNGTSPSELARSVLST